MNKRNKKQEKRNKIGVLEEAMGRYELF